MNGNIDNLLNDVEALVKKYDVTAYSLRHALDIIGRDECKNEIMDAVRSRKELLGKCYREWTDHDAEMFPPMYRYFKVINTIHSKDCIECLCFYEHPVYWFNYSTNDSAKTVAYKTGSFEFDSVTVKSMYSWDLINPCVEEITPLQYERAMGLYFQELIKLPWYTDHCRYGGMFPVDPKWPRAQDKG